MPDSDAAPWVEGLTIGQTLEATAARFRDGDALVFPQLNLRLSWRQFAERVDDAARGLLALGIHRGEHVAIWATNVPQWVVLQFATARIGAVLVTINPAYRPFELKYVLEAERRGGAVPGRSLQDVRLLRDARRSLSGAGQRRAGPSCTSAEFPQAALGRRDAQAQRRRSDLVGRNAARRGRSRPACANRRSAAGLEADRADQHSIHLRHDRLSQGRHAQPSQPAAQRLLRRHVPEADGRAIGFAFRCRSITASAACWARSARSSTARR